MLFSISFLCRQSETYFTKSQGRIGGKYMKTRYHQYTDATFSVKEVVPDKEKHLGILGPVIRAEVGDEIKVVLLNRSPYPASLYLQGVTFDKSQDGLLQKKPFGKKLSFNCLLSFCND